MADTVPGPAKDYMGVLIRATETASSGVSSGGLSSRRAKTFSSSCRSSLLLAKKPKVSKVGAKTVWPSSDMALKVGFMAKTPVKDAVRMILPPVCAPRLSGTCRSATAAAGPHEEPPGVRFGSWGLVVSGPELVTVNSAVVVFLPVGEGQTTAKRKKKDEKLMN